MMIKLRINFHFVLGRERKGVRCSMFGVCGVMSTDDEVEIIFHSPKIVPPIRDHITNVIREVE